MQLRKLDFVMIPYPYREIRTHYVGLETVYFHQVSLRISDRLFQSFKDIRARLIYLLSRAESSPPFPPRDAQHLQGTPPFFGPLREWSSKIANKGIEETSIASITKI